MLAVVRREKGVTNSSSGFGAWKVSVVGLEQSSPSAGL